MPKMLPNGLGGTSGRARTLAEPLYASGVAVFVDSVTGDAAFDGLDRKRPKPTLAEGVAVAAAAAEPEGCVITMLSTHTEEITTAVSVANQALIIGEGLVAGVPSVRLIKTGGTGSVVTFAAGSRGSGLHNVRFLGPAAAATPGAIMTEALVAVETTDIKIEGCYLDLDDLTNRGIRITASSTRLVDVTCVAVGDDPVAPGIEVTTAVTEVTMEGCVLDGGSAGFASADGSLGFRATAAITALDVLNLSLLSGADMLLVTGTTGTIFLGTTTGSSCVIWPD